MDLRFHLSPSLLRASGIVVGGLALILLIIRFSSDGEPAVSGTVPRLQGNSPDQLHHLSLKATEGQPSRRRLRPARKPASPGLEAIREMVAKRNLSHLHAIIQKFGPGEFDEVWTLLDSLPPQPFIGELRARAAQRGVALDGIGQVLPEILASKANQEQRDQMIEMAFLGPRSLVTVLDAFGGLPDAAAKTAAARGMAAAVASRKDLAEVLQGIDLINPEIEGILSEGLGRYPGAFFHTMPGMEEDRARGAIAYAKELQASGRVSQRFLETLAVHLAGNMAERMWGIVSTTLPEVTTSPAVIDAFTTKMSSRDAPAALEFALQQDLAGADAIATAVSRGMYRHPVGLTTWFEERRDTLPPRRADEITIGFARFHAGKGDFDEAAIWLDQIRDSRTKASHKALLEKARHR